VVIPTDGYLKEVRSLCDQYNVLMIADEGQTGCGRTGKMLAVDHEQVRPDMVVLGKALSGGMYPVSAVLGSDEVMLTIGPGEHGSTYGGNPLGSAVAMAALRALVDEGMVENAQKMGELLRLRLREGLGKVEGVQLSVRGRGLMNAVIVGDASCDSDSCKPDALDLCHELMRHGLLAKPTHGRIIRLAPPLVINSEQIEEAADIIVAAAGRLFS